MREIIFWQHSVSPHQAAYLRAMASRPDVTVTLIVGSPLREFRRNMGWEEPNFDGVNVIPMSTTSVEQVVRNFPPGAFHIFGGLRAYPALNHAFDLIAGKRGRIGILSEPIRWTGVKGAIRRLRYVTVESRYMQSVQFVLALGRLAEEWFRMSGVAADKIYPFAYSVEHYSVPDVATPNQRIQIIFCGQCIHRKGLDLLLRALSAIERLPWDLTVIGDGDERPRYEQLCQQLGLPDRVTFMGTQQNSDVRRLVAGADVLVHPSRWDGWGAAVNEALLCGVPVLASSRTGANILLDDPLGRTGKVFASGSVSALAAALTETIQKGSLQRGDRLSLKAWSTCIQGDALGAYLLDILDHLEHNRERPVPPWTLRHGSQ